MSARLFSPEEIAAHRALYATPHWMIEVLIPGYAVLIGVPATEQNRNRVLAGSPGVTPDMLDGLQVRSTWGNHADAAPASGS